MSKSKGVFNFNEQFPGPHMIRVRLQRHQAWDMLRQLAKRLQGDGDVVDFAWFGTLVRDEEEDQGNPIETGK